MTSTTSSAGSAAGVLQVVATAGHVDHGKSSLILRLTGMDPDRWAEEKRRGLTIDLGFAWCRLPSGREIGFVDVPGHERFVRNMLAGVGPVRLVLFVVAADEGWKPQSEEHLAIVDVLGCSGAVVALTKRDLVDAETLALADEEVRERLRGTALEDVPVVAVSSESGEGLEGLVAALDEMVGAAPPGETNGRLRQHVDRVFSIKGAGTVVTGTLAAGTLAIGDEVELYPTGARARVRSLQTHKRSIERALPVSRVAANLVGIDREELERGDVLGRPGEWRPTTVIEARLQPVRGLEHVLTGRGAFKLYAGSAERDARVRLYGAGRIEPGDREGAFARIRLSGPLVLDVFDRFVLREAGRRETVAGGIVLDVEPPARPGPNADRRLRERERASREKLPSLLARERGAVRSRHVRILTGVEHPSAIEGVSNAGAWWVAERVRAAVEEAVVGALDEFHRTNPLQEGADLADVRGSVSRELRRAGAPDDAGLVEALLETLEASGRMAREGQRVRLATHRVTLAGREEEVERLIAAVAKGEPTPPTIAELLAAGFDREVLDASTRGGLLVKVSSELVFTPAFVERAEAEVRTLGADGTQITVSAFRERLGTSRKFALPLLEHFDRTGLTRRSGEARILRGS